MGTVMLLKLRTILILLMAALVIGLGTTLSMWSLWSSTSAARDAGLASASEQAVAGVMAIEHVLGEREAMISSIAEMIRQGASENDAFDMFERFWLNYKKKFQNHGSLKYAKESGGGIICHRESAREVVTRGETGKYTAKNTETGQTRPVSDMRLEPWYVSARDSAGQGYTELHPTHCPFDGQWRRCVTIYQKVIDSQGRFSGAIGVELTMDWYADYLNQAMNRSVFASRSFAVERKKDGTFNLIADTAENSARLDNSAAGPSAGFIDAMTHGNGILSEAVRAMPDSLSDFNALKPIHKSISTKSGPYLATYLGPFPGRPPDWMICFLINEDDLFRPARKHLYTHLATVALGLVAAIALAAWISVKAVQPIESVTAMAGKLERLEVEDAGHGETSAIREVDDLSRAISRATVGLRSFLKYVPQELLKGYMASGQHAQTGGVLREVTVAFIDIKDYSSVSEKLGPMELVTHLNRFLEEVCGAVSGRRGTVDKFIGDAVMAFWNAPEEIEGHAREACGAMADCLSRIESVSPEWKALGLPVWEPRIGIHTGEVIVGNIGSNSRLNYTIIGDAVNLASRLEALNRTYGTAALMTEATRALAGSQFLTRPVDLVAVKGKSVPVLVHELMGRTDSASPSLKQLAVATAEAHSKLAAREYGAARGAYAAILASHPEDTLSRVMAERCAELEANPPRAEWSGVFRLNTK